MYNNTMLFSSNCYDIVLCLGNFSTGRGSEGKERRGFEGVTVRKGIHPFLTKINVSATTIDIQTYIAADTVHVVQQPQYVCTRVVSVQLCIFDVRCTHYRASRPLVLLTIL